MTIQNEKLFQKVLPVLQSKLEEFKYFGYDSITIEDIWNYCLVKKWRKLNIDELRLHEAVETVFSIKASDLVSQFQIQQFKEDHWFSEIKEDELKSLLNS